MYGFDVRIESVYGVKTCIVYSVGTYLGYGVTIWMVYSVGIYYITHKANRFKIKGHRYLGREL